MNLKKTMTYKLSSRLLSNHLMKKRPIIGRFFVGAKVDDVNKKR